MAKENTSGGLVHNALAAGTTVVGNIVSPKDIRIDGQIEGNVTCEGKVVVGQLGAVIGNIQAVNAEIMGAVKGNVSVTELLSLKASARFEGDISTRTLAIEPQATFNGKCSIIQE